MALLIALLLASQTCWNCVIAMAADTSLTEFKAASSRYYSPVIT
nr:hypothetical protein [uncultured Rhodoferax sp.]